MSGYYYCENCEGNAGGRQCVACNRPAQWISQPPAQPSPETRNPKAATPSRNRRPPGVSQERGHQRFEEIRALIARVT